MGNYSKLIAAIIGPILAFAVAQFGLPESWASPEFTATLVTFVTGLFVYIAPANKPS